MIRQFSAIVCALAALVPPLAEARPATELACIEALFSEDQARAMAELGSADPQVSKAAADKINWMVLGMQSRTCALRGRWSDNEYANSIGYMMAWPTARGLRLAGEAQGYAALDRAYGGQAAELVKETRLSAAQIDAVMAAAATDGLLLHTGEAAVKDARRYVDALQQLDAMRADFAAGRKPRGMKR